MIKGWGVDVREEEAVFVIGRFVDCDLIIDDETVSGRHLAIFERDDGYLAVDCGSTNGTFLEDSEYSIQSFPLESGKTIYLGDFELRSDEILAGLKASKDIQDIQGIEIELTGERISIGRALESDVHLPNANVSRFHAELIHEGSKFRLIDLGSTNGTLVNGQLVTNKGRLVGANDEISIGPYTFDLQVISPEKSVLSSRASQGFSIEAESISRVVGEGIRILDDISLTINPGEMVGLMGLSGAGKTTLLKVLNGNDPPSSGATYINGLDLLENFWFFRSMIGYVPQDDIVHPELTVGEALRFYADLRLPPDTEESELSQRIEQTLDKLGLSGTEGTLIGSPDTAKGISGGQRKRVNLAMELLSDPQIIFLDEPTSGLSAVDTRMVMELLRRLAGEGKTIIITIHQPSLQNYKLLDTVIILSFGKLAYYGPCHPESILFFNNGLTNDELLSNPDNALIGLHQAEIDRGEYELDARSQRNEKGVYWQQKYLASDFASQYVRQRKGSHELSDHAKAETSSYARQFVVLAHRFSVIKLKDRANTLILLAQAPLIGFMTGILFSEEAYLGSAEALPGMATMMFVLAISAIWFGNVNSCREIVAEKAILHRESKVGVGVVPYVYSKFIVLGALCFLQTILLLGSVKVASGYSLGFGASFWSLFAIVFVTAMIGLSIGLVVSAIAKSQSQALALIPIVLLPMIIFGGGMMSVKQMADNENPFSYTFSMIMPTRWAVEEMVHVYEGRNPVEDRCESIMERDFDNSGGSGEALEACLQLHDLSESLYGEGGSRQGIRIGLGVIFVFGPLFIVILIMKRRYVD